MLWESINIQRYYPFYSLEDKQINITCGYTVCMKLQFSHVFVKTKNAGGGVVQCPLVTKNTHHLFVILQMGCFPTYLCTMLI